MRRSGLSRAARDTRRQKFSSAARAPSALGLLYIAGGIVLVSQPVSGSLILTYVLGVVLFASGCVRLYVGIRHWAGAGWLILLSGIFGILAGLVILVGWPVTGLWVIGFLLGIDLIFHGFGWLLLAW